MSYYAELIVVLFYCIKNDNDNHTDDNSLHFVSLFWIVPIFTKVRKIIVNDNSTTTTPCSHKKRATDFFAITFTNIDGQQHISARECQSTWCKIFCHTFILLLLYLVESLT